MAVADVDREELGRRVHELGQTLTLISLLAHYLDKTGEPASPESRRLIAQILDASSAAIRQGRGLREAAREASCP